MYNVRLWLYISVVFLLIAAGCTGEAGTSEEGDTSEVEQEEADKEEDGGIANLAEALEAQDVPQTTEELIAYPAGPLSGQYFDDNREEIEETLSKLPKIDETPEQETVKAYWAKLLSLFAEDYPDPADLLSEWKMTEFGNPEWNDPRLQFKENYNVEIILDASGSMANVIGDKTMMELAKEAIRDFAAALPEEANVGLRVYGHKGSNADADKKVSCESSELVYDIQPYDEDKLKEALDQFEPTGWTPIARSLEGAQQDLADYDGENNTNIIYLVSDGVETCDGDPVKVAKALSESDVTPLINVIGFNVDGEGQEELRKIAEAADGHYATAQNQEQLKQELDRSQEIATKWIQWKLDADTENINTLQERESSVHAFKNEWGEKKSREYRNLDEAIHYLSANGHIPHGMREPLRDLREKHYNLVNDLENTTYQDLKSVARKSFEEMEEEIKEKYGQNAP